MSGWDKERVKVFKQGLNDFIKHLKIDSKETEGGSSLVLYNSQKRFLAEVFKGLEEDKHFFVCLKARQLGISTIVRALLVFWAFIHPGNRIALVYDTDSNKEDARQEIERFLAGLPLSHRIGVKYHNRTHCEFLNGSRISYFVAGIKKTKSSGGLGRSRGISCCGATEVSSWGDVEGLRAFERSLAEKNPNRLYIFESTARSFNIFYQMWEEAKADDLSKVAIFIGWWAKEDYAIERGSPLFDRYGTSPPTDEEQAKIDTVREKYGHDVTMEQLAWWRHQYDPGRDADEREHVGQDIIMQELPWTEDDAFLMSGAKFFGTDVLTAARKDAAQEKPKGYRYLMTDDFLATVLEPVTLVRKATLRVWEEPEEGAVYCIGADPAYGSSDTADRYCAQIIRCYADGIDQVAEFCTTDLTTYQFAWVIAHLCGAYKNARLLLELNGPGNAVWNEFRTLDLLLKAGYLKEQASERGLDNIFQHVRQYLWAKEDTLSRHPTAFHWETTTKRKVQIMERLRDFLHVKQLRVRSPETLDEMAKIVRDGDSIHGEGTSKDDRVMALALALKAWEDSERKALIAQQRTRENEAKRRSLTHADLQEMFSQSLVQNFFNRQSHARVMAQAARRRAGRWQW